MLPRPILLLAVAFSLGLLAACGQEATGGAEPTLSISSPAQGASLGGPVRLAVSVHGAEVGPDGAMHLHVYVDGSDDYDVVTSTDTTVALPDGTHTIRVVLADPNHEETGISDSVTVSVSGAPVGGGDTGGGYGDTGGYG